MDTLSHILHKAPYDLYVYYDKRVPFSNSYEVSYELVVTLLPLDPGPVP